MFLYQIYNDLRAYVTEAEDDYTRPIATRTYNSSWALYDDHLVGMCLWDVMRWLWIYIIYICVCVVSSFWVVIVCVWVYIHKCVHRFVIVCAWCRWK